MKLEEIITVDPDIQFGTPVFRGTRVPVESLFWHLEKSVSLDEFLDEFPSVTREQAVALMEMARRAVTSSKLEAEQEEVRAFAAQDSGFDFWHDEREDIYQDYLPKPA